MPNDFDASHGFLSTKGTAAARLLSARIANNQIVRQKANDILAAIDNADEVKYDERSILALKIKSETLLDIDTDAWHSLSDLTQPEDSSDDDEPVFDIVVVESD